MYIKKVYEGRLVIQKSEFITYLKPVKTIEEYQEYLKAIRKEHHNANHACSAVVLKNQQRSSDDNEPSGSAGVPILQVLLNNELTDVCALVVRYFGGIKLGMGGLIRAYSKAVADVVKECERYIAIPAERYSLTVDYETAHKLLPLLKQDSCDLESDYDQEVTFAFTLEDPAPLTKITEITKGISPTKTADVALEKMVK